MAHTQTHSDSHSDCKRLVLETTEAAGWQRLGGYRRRTTRGAAGMGNLYGCASHTRLLRAQGPRERDPQRERGTERLRERLGERERMTRARGRERESTAAECACVRVRAQVVCAARSRPSWASSFWSDQPPPASPASSSSSSLSSAGQRRASRRPIESMASSLAPSLPPSPRRSAGRGCTTQAPRRRHKTRI